ncbi:MAG: glycosyltransferase family 87 protein [Saprospiraceae bacterium]
MKVKKIEIFILTGFFIILSFCAFYFNGTGDDGDSILHYIYAKYAFSHPENFFNHWAKPIYVILMAPFAQLGFVGVKMMNVILITLAMYFTFGIAEKIEIYPKYLVGLFFIGAPILYSVTLSGLTEPLFAFWLIFGIYLAFKDKLLLATLFLSFLPFVRSEGLIILAVFAIYLVVKKAWRHIPFLVIGHVVMGILGWPVHRDFMWSINKIPYAQGRNESYGKGEWDYYILHFTDIFGYFITIVLIITLAFALLKLIGHLTKKVKFNKEELWLIYGMFIAFFVAHSIFWAKGIFNSYGLLRIFLAVLPLIALMCAKTISYGFKEAKKSNLNYEFGFVIIPLILCGLFYHQKIISSLKLNEDQEVYQTLVLKHKNIFKDRILYSDAVYPSLLLDLDFNNPLQSKRTSSLYNAETVSSKSVIIWDYRFSIVESHLNIEKLKADSRFKLIDVFNIGDKPSIYLFALDSIVDTSHVFLRYDFEKERIIGIDSSMVKSGKFSNRIDKLNEFSPGIFEPIKSFEKSDLICFKFDYYFKGLPMNKVLIVSSYEDDKGNILDWKSFNFINADSRRAEWNSCIYNLKIDHSNVKYKMLKIYIWNPSENSIYLDNLEFSAF